MLKTENEKGNVNENLKENDVKTGEPRRKCERGSELEKEIIYERKR